ncbi:MAG: hypothetical protein ACRDOA_10230 [Streptosporangiaceae bacterium]
MGDRKRVSRKRAVGTREHIIAYLADNTELFDPGGMASTRLAAAVGYPGSSVAFAQLLSGMERSGLIEREVRGKRTYRIRMGSDQAAGTAANPAVGSAVGSAVGDAAGSAAGGLSAAGDAAARAGGASGVRGLAGMLGPGAASGFDYDELARRLLAQVVRRLAGAGATDPAVAPDAAALRETVAGLEYELADAWAKHGKLAEENVRLREQLGAAEQSLALARESLRRLPVAADLDRSEVLLLQRLLAGDTVAGSLRA